MRTGIANWPAEWLLIAGALWKATKATRLAFLAVRYKCRRALTFASLILHWRLSKERTPETHLPRHRIFIRALLAIRDAHGTTAEGFGTTLAGYRASAGAPQARGGKRTKAREISSRPA
jgi:hypothetical protein